MKALLLAALLLATAGLTGCGYTTKRLEDFPSARAIAVVPFENMGFRRDLELRLTQAVVEEIRSRTSFALATPGRADLVLRGRMEADEIVTVQGQNRQPIQKLLAGRLRVTLENRGGQVLRTESVSTAAQYRTEGVYNESLDGSASDEWVRRMAVRIVQILERSF